MKELPAKKSACLRPPLLWGLPVVLLFLLFTSVAAAQSLALSVLKTDQSCPGNGSLSFSVQNAAPNTPVTFRVFRLPDTATAIAVQSTPTVAGLVAGSYLITAAQVVNGNNLTDSKNVTIANTFVPLTYTLASQDATCGPNGKIMVSINSGTAVSYEIMSGPVIRPPQASSTLSGLPGGTYQVRVTDNCGNGVVVTHTLFSAGPILDISPGSNPDASLPACDKIKMQHTISVSNSIPMSYPLSLQWTLYPPDGSPPFTVPQTINSGSVSDIQVSHIFPFYYDTDYYYDLTVTDPCGNTYTNHTLVRGVFSAGATFANAECGKKYLKIAFDTYVPPCTITFSAYPSGFDPVTFNPAHPGPFMAPEVNYGGTTSPVPYGSYTYTATDACGHSFTQTVNNIPPVVTPESVGYNGDCQTGLGSMTIRINDFEFASAIIVNAPPAFIVAHPLPYDVSGFILGPDGLKIENMLPPGNYTVMLVDTCGNSYPPEDVTVPPYTGGTFGGNVRPDCTPGMSTVRITGGGVPLISVIIESAPANAPFTTPYNATALLSADGNLYMDNLPPGPYTFKGATTCSANLTTTLNLVANTTTANSYAITPHCGSFDIVVNHTSTGTAFASLWLQQKLDYNNNTWGNPIDGTEYPEGTIPTTANSIAVSSGTTIFNLPYIGDFRILKRYQSFGNGNPDATKDCFEVLHEFRYSGNLEITDVVSVNCSGTNADVEVKTNGVPPIHYTIQEKNYQPFFLDNGNSPFFNNLEPAVYTFRAEDSCGRFRSRSFNVAALPSMAIANATTGLHLCDTDGSGTETFDLAGLSATILDTQTGPQHSITYHATRQDADNGANPLPLSYTTGTGIVFARVLYTGPTSTCYATTSFPLMVTAVPDLYMPDTAAFCEGGSVTLEADAGYSNYSWDGGPATANYEVSTAGTYAVTVTDNFGCSSTKSVTVTSYQAPVLQSVDIKDWTTSDNIITVYLQNPSDNFLYSIDGINYQQSPTFTNLNAGYYTVYVKDLNDCGTVHAEAVVLSYPKFFTPNGDGQNETWRIKFAMAEPGLEVMIFDRFGKLITAFGPDGGWDGTYNGARLPATDYWFVVRRQDGRQLRGHFSMLR